MRFRNWKLSTKQIVVFGVILILMAAANFNSLRNVETITSEFESVTSNWFPRVIAISDANFGAADLRILQLQYAIAGGEEARQELTSKMITALDRIVVSLERYDSLTADMTDAVPGAAEERTIFKEFDRHWEEYQDISTQYILLSRDHKTDQAIALLRGDRAERVFDQFRTALLELGRLNLEYSTAAAARADARNKGTHHAAILLFLLVVLIAATIAVLTARLITRPLRQLTGAAGHVADGDLTVQIPIDRSDEVGILAKSFNHMTSALRDAHNKMQEQADRLREQNDHLERTMKELRDAQEQLLLQEKMAGLGQLVAVVAHEINSPIGTIMSVNDTSARCVQRIEDASPSAAPEAKVSAAQLHDSVNILKENISITRTAGSRIAELVHSFEDFARLDQSAYQVTDIRTGIESSLTLLGKDALHDITIVRELADIPKIPCYPAELNQVFLNILRNACEAIDGEGTITVRTREEKSTVIVEIADTGRGIEKERLSHVFDFGFSRNAARVKMGSGLTTSYRIIQKHRGEIAVESEMGKGTTVRITLPRSPK